MAYTPQTWANAAAGGTPLSADRLNHIESGLQAAAAAADGAASGAAQKAANLSDLASAGAARSNLGAAANVSGGAEKTFTFSATTGTITGDLSQGSCSTQLTPTGNFTVALSNVPASGTACTVTIIITSGATAYTASWPAGTDWGVTSPPTLTAGKSTVITLLTVNGGTTWHARAA